MPHRHFTSPFTGAILLFNFLPELPQNVVVIVGSRESSNYATIAVHECIYSPCHRTGGFKPCKPVLNQQATVAHSSQPTVIPFSILSISLVIIATSWRAREGAEVIDAPIEEGRNSNRANYAAKNSSFTRQGYQELALSKGARVEFLFLLSLPRSVSLSVSFSFSVYLCLCLSCLSC